MDAFRLRGPRPLFLRVWHVLNALAIFALLATVFLRDELVGVREHRTLIQDALSSQGVSVTAEQATAVAKLYLDRLWGWHVGLGLALAGLLLGRAIFEALVPRGTGLCAKIKGALGPAKSDKGAREYAAVKMAHAAFYAVLAGNVATGLVCAYGKAWGVPGSVRHAFKEAHEASMYAVIAFIAAHLIGVVRAELSKEPGLVSDMVNGGRP